MEQLLIVDKIHVGNKFDFLQLLHDVFCMFSLFGESEVSVMSFVPVGDVELVCSRVV
jgi:hypothetical protein